MYDTILAKSPFIIYKPGGVTAGLVVTTWAQVQEFIAYREGAVIVYVDDSIVSPASVPGASGLTDCGGRVEIRTAYSDSEASAVLLVQDGATLRNLSIIRGAEVQCDTRGGTPALDWTAADGGNLLIKDFGSLSNAATATQPAITIAAATTLFLNMEEGALILNAPAVPLFSVAATGLLQVWALDATDLSSANPGFAMGAGNVALNYDNASAHFFGAANFFVPPPLPGITGTYHTVNVDAILPNPGPQAQATWFIDPQNVTGLADDDNSGIDATHPVLTYNFGVARKWTTYSPILRQDTTLTWLSSQPVGTADPIVISPVMVGSVLTLQGPLGPAQLLHSGALAGVVPKNRATGQLLAANLGFAVTTNMLVKNTTAGKISFAWVYVPGTPAELTQPLNPATMPFDFSTVVSEVDTWADGDTFEIYAPLQADLVSLSCTVVEYNAGFADPVQVYHLVGFSADGAPADTNFTMGTNVTLVESAFDSVVEYPMPVDDEGAFASNCFFGSGLQCNPVGYGVTMNGGAVIAAPFASAIVSWSPGLDAIIDGTASVAILGSTPAVQLVADVYFKGTTHVSGSAFFRGIAWGPGSLDGLGSSRIGYTAPAATRFQVPTLLLNGQASANAFNPTTGLWSVLIPITAANLDLAFGAGGFGGLATNVGGASFSGQGTP